MFVNAQALGMTPSVLSNALNCIEAPGLVQSLASSGQVGDSNRHQVFTAVTDRGYELLASLATIEIEQ